MVSNPDTQQSIDRDYFLCCLSDLEDLQTIELTIADRQLFAIRQDNQLFAYWNSCPHMGVPLNWRPERFLDLDRTFLQCSSHGALFQIHDGECVAGPCVSDHLTVISLKAEGDHYFISANQPLPAPLINLRAAAMRDLD